mgnify:CR=1 FL=1
MQYGTSYKPSIPVAAPRPGFSPAIHRGRSAVNVTLNGTTLTIQSIRGGYIAVKYSLVGIIPDDFTIDVGQRWNTGVLVPCISWALVGGNERYRYRLAGTNGILPYEPYAGQLVDALTANIEFWAPGDVSSSVTYATQTIKLGVFTSNPDTTTTYTVDPCIIAATGSPGFAAYMTGCA